MEAVYVDHMGDDLRVVNAARVSFSKESEWANAILWDDGRIEPTLGQKDQKLINYLAKHGHWTPFSHVMITMREKVPIFVARQRFKHMVGFTYNEVSRRYVDDTPELFQPDVWRKSAENKKQGSSEEEVFLKNIYFWKEDNGDSWQDWTLYEELQEQCKRSLLLYERMIEVGVCPEQARMVLPQSMYTEYYVTGSLSAWARAYKLRIDSHAQKEIQDLAEQWNEVISTIPNINHSWSALTNVA